MSRSVVGAWADATPASRDRTVDAVRAAAIVVVVLWHWVVSLTHRAGDGVVVMPNPIADVPGGWLATWVLQVVPAFFVVGGYANLAAWDASGRRAGMFVRRRARRLVAPVAVWLGLWLLAETVASATIEGHRPLWVWFPGVLTPLWFVLAYVAVTLAVPWTARAHRRAPRASLGAALAALAVCELLARGAGSAAAAWGSTALVWLIVHQLGYGWRDRGLRPGPGAALAIGGLLGLVVLTTVGGYPRSMVADGVQDGSNLWPTNATVVALAVLQLGLIALAAPLAARVLERRWAWLPVVALNAVALTVFVWHMTAYAAVFVVVERLGADPSGRPGVEWLLARPFWLLAPGVVLLVLIAVFGRVEHGTSGRRAGSDGEPDPDAVRTRGAS